MFWKAFSPYIISLIAALALIAAALITWTVAQNNDAREDREIYERAYRVAAETVRSELSAELAAQNAATEKFLRDLERRQSVSDAGLRRSQQEMEQRTRDLLARLEAQGDSLVSPATVELYRESAQRWPSRQTEERP